MKRRFSTSDVAGRDRVEYWRSWLSNEFQPVDVRGYSDDGFYVECEFDTIGSLDTTIFRGSGQAFARPTSSMRSYNSDTYVLVITGPSRFDHNDRSETCQCGDMILFDATKSYVIAHEPDIQVVSVVLPRVVLDSYLPNVSSACGLVLRSREAAASLIRDCVASVMRQSEAMSAELTQKVSLIAIDLIAAGFAEKTGFEAKSPGARRYAKIARAHAFIAQNIADPRLDLPMIAAAAGASLRGLQALFKEEGTSVADVLWEARLQRAHRLLAGDPDGLLTIGLVASRVGFRSAAHFSRRFKTRFGYAPSETREYLRGTTRST